MKNPKNPPITYRIELSCTHDIGQRVISKEHQMWGIVQVIPKVWSPHLCMHRSFSPLLVTVWSFFSVALVVKPLQMKHSWVAILGLVMPLRPHLSFIPSSGDSKGVTHTTLPSHLSFTNFSFFLTSIYKYLLTRVMVITLTHLHNIAVDKLCCNFKKSVFVISLYFWHQLELSFSTSLLIWDWILIFHWSMA